MCIKMCYSTKKMYQNVSFYEEDVSKCIILFIKAYHSMKKNGGLQWAAYKKNQCSFSVDALIIIDDSVSACIYIVK